MAHQKKEEKSTLCYVKGLSTPVAELDELGFTEFERFLAAYSQVFRAASIATVDKLLASDAFDKSKWNSFLQAEFKINKRHAGGVIAQALGRVDSAKKLRALHIATLEGKCAEIEDYLKKAGKKLAMARKFYSKKNWQNSKTGCNFPLACFVDSKSTNWQKEKFKIHQKKRKLNLFQNKIAHLKAKPLKVYIPHSDVFIVGSKDESFGSQACQWDGSKIKFRVPKCMEERGFGKFVETEFTPFDRNVNRMPEGVGSRTWHFYRKDGKWKAAVAFTPSKVATVTADRRYGAIGIDLNPSCIGWTAVDTDGNLKASGQIPLLQGLPTGKMQAQISDACMQLATLAIALKMPIVCEELDFSKKKLSLGEISKKMARMLSGWAYAEFFKTLSAICANRGIELITINPAYTSVIGMFKYARMYGLGSDCAAAMAIARRGMKLLDLIPSSMTAYFEVNSEKHVWSLWNQLNKIAKRSIGKRHNFYAISNWAILANPLEGNSI